MDHALRKQLNQYFVDLWSKGWSLLLVYAFLLGIILIAASSAYLLFAQLTRLFSRG